jgi:hypothetical protein
MMKKQLALAPVAALGLLLGTTALYAQSTTYTVGTQNSSVSAAVQGALQAPTGFLTGGQVQVTGVGQGSVVLERSTALVGLNAGATATIGSADLVPSSSSSTMSSFNFDRSVETGGALVGIGNVVAQGESLGGVGIIASANSNATSAGTGTRSVTTAGTPSVTTASETAGSSTTPTTAQGSLVGDFTTTNTMQLTGSGSLFAGAQTLSIGERNQGVSFGSTGLIEGDQAAINLAGATVSFGTGSALPTVSFSTGAGGAGFASQSVLSGSSIDLNASNAGNGTVLVSGSTGGFFGQGTAFGATAAPTFSQVNGFFSAP